MFVFNRPHNSDFIEFDFLSARRAAAERRGAERTVKFVALAFHALKLQRKKDGGEVICGHVTEMVLD